MIESVITEQDEGGEWVLAEPEDQAEEDELLERLAGEASDDKPCLLYAGTLYRSKGGKWEPIGSQAAPIPAAKAAQLVDAGDAEYLTLDEARAEAKKIIARVVKYAERQNMPWNEDDHPRDEGGQFKETDASSSTRVQTKKPAGNKPKITAELSVKEWEALSAMAAGLPSPAKGATIANLVARKLIERTPAGWYMLTDAGQQMATGQ